MMKVPTMAGPTPPPGSPGGVGRCTKKPGESPATPFETTSQRTETSGKMATSTMAAQARVATRFRAWRTP